MDEQLHLLIAITMFVGVCSEIYNFVNITQVPAINKSYAELYCEASALGHIPYPDTMVNLLYCYKRQDITGEYWLNNIEDATVLPEVSSWQCNFESKSPCFMQNQHKNGKGWSRSNRYMYTWPLFPTVAYEGHYFMYADASRGTPSHEYVFKSVRIQEDELCFQFHFHMYGMEIGRLRVMLVFDDTSNKTAWETHGNQGRHWHGVHLDIPSSVQYIYVIATTGTSSHKHIAIDNVRLKYGNCSLYSSLHKKSCGNVWYSQFGTILSPNYPREYHNLMRCSWEINVPDGYIIFLHIEEFYLEKRISGTCYDFIKIWNSVENKQYSRYCGDDFTAGQTIKWSSNKLFIEFQSDSWGSYKGFHISWTSERVICLTGMITKGQLLYKRRSCSDKLDSLICVKGYDDDGIKCKSHNLSLDIRTYKKGIENLTRMNKDIQIAITVAFIVCLVISLGSVWCRQRYISMKQSYTIRNDPDDTNLDNIDVYMYTDTDVVPECSYESKSLSLTVSCDRYDVCTTTKSLYQERHCKMTGQISVCKL